MRSPPRKALEMPWKLLAVMLVVCMTAASASMNVSAEIPHENYELVSSELDMLVDLLLTALNRSELTLINLYYEQMAWAAENLTVINGLLNPATQLLNEIAEIAESYENLSVLMPPFTDLSSEMSAFKAMESELTVARNLLRSFSMFVNLTNEQLIEALGAINTAESLLVSMYLNIERMLDTADEISSLEVDDQRPFQDNDLVVLIERLRELLSSIELELAELMKSDDDPTGGGIPWGENRTFLTLWLANTTLYLGDNIQGGGYLYFNGSFISDHEIVIVLNGDNLSAPITGSDGDFEFNHTIPINESWLGNHEVQAFASIDSQNLSSDSITISIARIPTTLIIEVDKTFIALRDELNLNITLIDLFERPIQYASCNLSVDDEIIAFTTDEYGRYEHSWDASELWLGAHEFQASYEGVLPFASSYSKIIEIFIDIPTTIELNLFAERLARGFYIVGNGTLVANDTEPLDDLTITLSIDGEEITNITTDDRGIFSFSIESKEMITGSHRIRAELLYRESMWRYSIDEVSFTLYVPQPTKKYPFWPFLPGWGGISPPQDFYDLFFGKYSYFVWLLIIMTIGIVVKTLQIRKNRKEEEAKRSAEELIESEGMGEIVELEEIGETIPEVKQILEMPSNPNERIVWYYNQLMGFLTKERKISIENSMTHWEIARLLRALDYPFEYVERATMLFEKAFYSGLSLEESDMDVMGDTVERLRSMDESGDADAA